MMNFLQNMKNNPMLNMLRMAKNPQQEMINMMENNLDPNNLFMKNILDIAKSGNNKQAETLARNVLKEAGIDPDELYRQLSSLR